MKIVQLNIGFSNPVLIINGSNTLLIDTGLKGNEEKYLKVFKNFGLIPSDIKLIVLTHSHYDHTGNLQFLKELTNAKVAIHKNEYDFLSKGITPIPKGTGMITKTIVKAGNLFDPEYAAPESFDADIKLDDTYDLKMWGIDGTVIHTPGHTNGSVSVKIGSTLIAGDCFFNRIFDDVFPLFANDPKLLLKTWEKLFELDIKTIYPGHGPNFFIDRARKSYKKWNEKLYLDF